MTNASRTVPLKPRRVIFVKSRALMHASCCFLLHFLATLAQGQIPGTIEMSVLEESPAGTIVGVLSTLSNYSCTFQDPTNLFEISGGSAVRTTQVIDRETLPSSVIRLSISGRHVHLNARQLTFSLVITILDINDNSPVFHLDGAARERISFQEDVRDGRKNIATAQDFDEGVNGRIARYAIVSGNEAGMFAIDLSGLPLILYIAKTGTASFDHESCDHYLLNISACDSGTPPKFGYLMVDIAIMDVNDNTPTFESSEYIAYVNESMEVGTLIFRAQASDKDLGLNGEVIYRLEDETRQFRIDEDTGVIDTLISPLRCSRRCERSLVKCTPNSCFVLIEASDKGLNALTGRTYLFVEVLDENDHDPFIIFSKDGSIITRASVDENAGKQTAVFSISVNDEDRGANGETALRIIKGNEEGYFFHLSLPDYGFNEVQVVRQLDRETIGSFNLTFEAVDKGIPPRSSTSCIIVVVNDANDHAPQFEQAVYEVNLSEYTQPRSFVANVRATDKDDGVNSKIRYQIATEVQGSQWFYVDPDTGLVKTTGRLDREQFSQVVLNITACDGGSDPKYGYARLVIYILDENDHIPSFSLATYIEELIENSPPGAEIVALTATDLDSGDNGTVEYFVHLDTEMRYPKAFNINLTSGKVTALQSFDRETINMYVIKVVARDKGPKPLSATATIELTIADVNDNRPVFSPKEYYVNVFENDPLELQIVQISAKDKDSGVFGQVTYSMRDQCNSFQINAQSGVISTDRSMPSSKCRLIVRASDGGGSPADGQAVVHVIMINSSSAAPVFTRSFHEFVITEDNGEMPPRVGRTVGRVEALSVTGRTISYKISGGDSEGIFTVDSSGTIRTQFAVDREERSQYNLTLIAYDGGKISSGIVVVEVSDLNDNAPVFDYRDTDVTVQENWPAKYEIFLAKATDEDTDINQDISYSITSHDDLNSVFAVNQTSGMVYLAKPVSHSPASSASLIIHAVDAGVSPKSSSLYVKVRIEDVNNHCPVFSKSSYDLLVSESQPINDVVMLLSASDPDRPMDGELIYTISKGNEDERFGIFPDGSLFVAHELDRERQDMYLLTVVVQDSRADRRSSSANIRICIQDENDNQPIFSPDFYEFAVKENNKPGILIGAVKASDEDIGRNSEIIYSLVDDNVNFSVDPLTGSIYAKRMFDREHLTKTTNRGYYVFDVLATDSGMTQLSGQVSVKVQIQDQNDSPPVFNQMPGTIIEISENAEINDVVYTFMATDEDELADAAVSYSIVHDSNAGLFGIHETLGQLYLRQKLDREIRDHYILTVKAANTSPGVELVSYISVQVIVVDFNDNIPQFAPGTQAYVSTGESTPPGVILITFSGSDRDQSNNGKLRFDIISGNEDNIFALDVDSGELSLVQRLDYESVAYRNGHHVLNISLSDSGFQSHSVSMLFTLKVSDENDNTPEFLDGLSKVYAKESTPRGSKIAALSATDKDSDDIGRIKYSFFKQTPGGDYFSINEDTGEIIVNTDLDREKIDTFKVVVHAIDQDMIMSQRRTAEKTLSIFIEDNNDNFPVFLSSNVFLVPLSSSIDSTVASVSATDHDLGDNGKMYYSFSGDKPTLFSLNPITGQISLAQALPADSHNHTLTITATDGGKNDSLGTKSTAISITIFVYTNNGTTPSFSRSDPIHGIVPENAIAGTRIMQINVSPCLACSRVDYYITQVTVAGRSCGGLFSVDRSSGVISTSINVDREELPGDVFLVDISAIEMDSSGLHAGSTQVTITVLDQNDCAPLFSSSLFDARVAENVRPGSSVAWIQVSDPDTTGHVVLSLRGADSNEFRILQNGTLLTKDNLDYELKPYHSFSVEADDGVTKSTARIYIRVIDDNDNPPVFSHPIYSFGIPESADIGHTIGAILATDADSGNNGHVIYECVSDWGCHLFDLDTNLRTFVLKQKLDFEECQLYVLRVVARDQGARPKVTEVKVYMNILDANDNPPVFSSASYQVEISEEDLPGTFVTNVSATDVDLGLNGTIRYSILDHASKFGVGPINGSVYTTGPLDREILPIYTVVVMATDQAPDARDRLTATATVQVNLLDVNDNPPMFLSPEYAQVSEDSEVGSTVFTVLTEDLDSGANNQISYKLVSHSSLGNVFSIEPSSGDLLLTSQLDRETMSNYTLIIEATDGGTSPHLSQQILVIKVTDVNDNAPRFIQEEYQETVLEDVGRGTRLLRVQATDLDEASNGAIRYFIVGGQNIYDFQLDMFSGVLSVHSSLDYERTKSYSIVIQAEDSSTNNPLHSNVSVFLNVIDLNDCAPVFLDCPYVAFVLEGLSDGPVHVITISATDGDSGDSGRVQYMLRDVSSHTEMFEVNTHTGQVFVRKTLDRETVPFYVLTLVALDRGSPAHTGTATVTVIVMDINDHAPLFDRRDLHQVHVRENQPPGTEVLTVLATDLDEGINSQIVYTLQNHTRNLFSIDPSTGVIQTTASLDRELHHHHTLTIVATDRGLDPRSSSAQAIIHIDDENDNVPQFGTNNYTTVWHSCSNTDFVIGLTAVDQDSGNNGKVIYTLESRDGESFFQINSETGVVTKTSLPRIIMTFTFNVRATDLGSHPLSSSTSVSVTISSSSTTNCPQFRGRSSTHKIHENAEIGRVIATVKAFAKDKNSKVTYYVAGGNINNAFAVNLESGDITVAGSIDYEITKKFNLWLEARVNGAAQLSSFTEMTVMVLDDNDNEPVFSSTFYTAEIDENCPVGTSIHQVVATDLDSGTNQQIVYTIRSGNDNNTFTVNSSSGVLTTVNPIVDREKIALFNIVVQATDMGSTRRSASCTIRIIISDKNDNHPTFTGSRSVAIPEDISTGSLIMQLSTIDPDTGRNALVTFSFENTVDRFFPFAIDASSGNITNVHQLDAEAQSRYSFGVTVTDGSFIQKTTLIIRVVDVNDNPPRFQNTVLLLNFTERQPPMTKVVQLSAVDLDKSSPNNIFFFSLKRPSSLFELDSQTGEIFALKSIHVCCGQTESRKMNDYILHVLVSDLGVPSLTSSTTLIIRIVDANDHAPVFQSSHYFSAVPVNLPVSRSILQVRAEDKMDTGLNADIVYEVIDGSGISLFSVNSSSGEVSPLMSLKGNVNRKLKLRLKARDNGVPVMTSTTTVVLQVTEINVSPPSFDSSHFQAQVSEDVAEGYIIDTITATDSDQGLNGEVSYNITSGNRANLFSIGVRDGILKVKGKLDFESNTSHTISITARDQALFFKEVTKTYTIILLDANDHSPVFDQEYYDAYIKENSEPNSLVVTVSATDGDTSYNNTHICFAMEAAADSRSLFRINQRTGEITVSDVVLDFEKLTLYTLLVFAFNPSAENCESSVRKSLATVYIHVVDEDESRPQFVQKNYTFWVSEAAEVGTSLGRVQAVDTDAGIDGAVFYFLEGESNLMGFSVESTTGIVRVSSRLDFESAPHIDLTVIAKNWGSLLGNDTETCAVNIHVSDANDPPVFSRDIYHANISENCNGSTYVTMIFAEDRDMTAENRDFSYELISGNENGQFQLDQSGRIETTGVGALDREAKVKHMLVVGARDIHNPLILGLAKVELELTDVNDNGPIFSPVDLRANITENSTIGTQVILLKVYTRDADLPPNQGPYRYKMAAGPWADYFSVDESTGRVETKRIINRDTHPHMFIPLVVTDNGRPRMTSTLNLTIVVENIPKLKHKLRSLIIFLNRIGSDRRFVEIADISPFYVDSDQAFTCRITNGDDSPFFISQACILGVVGDLPSSIYHLNIEASDGNPPSVEYRVTIVADLITNQTLSNSVAVVLNNETISGFLETKYSIFTRQIGEAFGASFICKIYSLKEAGTQLYVILYVFDKEKRLLSRTDIHKGLLGSKSGIEIRAHVSIDRVSADMCHVNPCLNRGKCWTRILLSGGTSMFESSNLVLHAPNTDLGTSCSCIPEYTGPYCDQPQLLCGTRYCDNGGLCVGGVCQCPNQWKGIYCEMDVNECHTVAPCKNGAACENTKGSFNCHCSSGYHGTHCDYQSFCSRRPCAEHGTCQEVPGSFLCICDYGYYGPSCQSSSLSFDKGSYAQFSTDGSSHIFNATMFFATVAANALLLFSPVTIDDVSSGFVAIEIVKSKVKVSFLLEPQKNMHTSRVITVSTSDPVNNGIWHSITFTNVLGIAKLLVQSCPDSTCVQCSDHSHYCYSQATYLSGNHNVIARYISIGGVSNFTHILQYNGLVSTHDFHGCLHSVTVNGRSLAMEGRQVEDIRLKEVHGLSGTCPRGQPNDLCAGREQVCYNKGVCVDRWSHVACRCASDYMDDLCLIKKQPITLGHQAVIQYTLRRSYVYDQKLLALVSETSRMRRGLGESTVTLRFRTQSDQGVLMHTHTDSVSCVIWLADKKAHFLLRSNYTVPTHLSGGAALSVSDGGWHNVSVTGSGTMWELHLDGQSSGSGHFDLAFDFGTLDIVEMTIGGKASLPGIGDFEGFQGCMSQFVVNGESLPLNGSSEKYDIQVSGVVGGTCTALCDHNPCGGYKTCVVDGESYRCLVVAVKSVGPEKGFLVVVVLIVLSVIGILAGFVLFHMHRDPFQICARGRKQSQDSGGHVGQAKNRTVDIVLAAGSSGSARMHRKNSRMEGSVIQKHIAENLMDRENRSLLSWRDAAAGHEIRNSSHSSDVLPDRSPGFEPDASVSFIQDARISELYSIEDDSSTASSDSAVFNTAEHYRDFNNACHPQHHLYHRHQQAQPSNSYLTKVYKDSPLRLNVSEYMITSPSEDIASGERKHSSPSFKGSALHKSAERSLTMDVTSGYQHSFMDAAHHPQELSNCQSELTNMNVCNHHPFSQAFNNSSSNNNSCEESIRSLGSHHGRIPTCTLRIPNCPTDPCTQSSHEPSRVKATSYKSSTITRLARDGVDRPRSQDDHNSLMQLTPPHLDNHPGLGIHHCVHQKSGLDSHLLLDPSTLSSDESEKSDSFTGSEFEYDIETG